MSLWHDESVRLEAGSPFAWGLYRTRYSWVLEKNPLQSEKKENFGAECISEMLNAARYVADESPREVQYEYTNGEIQISAKSSG